MRFYHYPCSITSSHRFGLLDDDWDLRCTSFDIEGVVEYKMKVGWGTIIRIEVSEKGIKFLEVVNDIEAVEGEQ